jgi:hypothetical protein
MYDMIIAGGGVSQKALDAIGGDQQGTDRA